MQLPPGDLHWRDLRQDKNKDKVKDKLYTAIHQVGPTGEICVNTLKKDWTPDLGIRHILLVRKKSLMPVFERGRIFFFGMRRTLFFSGDQMPAGCAQP